MSGNDATPSSGGDILSNGGDILSSGGDPLYSSGDLLRAGAVQQPAREIVLVLHNIRSTYNVGAILRTAEGFGVSRVVLSGYAPRVHDPNLLPHLRDKLDREIHKTALGAEELVDIYSSSDIISDLKKWQKQGWQILGLENNIQKSNLVMLNDPKLKERLSDRVILILGEEVNGIDYSFHDIIDLFIEIPMRGRKESFNVSVAAGVAVWGIGG